MICNLILYKFIFRNKKLKMSDQTTYFPFGGIGEIVVVVRRKDWYAMQQNLMQIRPFHL